jgi:hypothetical protein
MYNKISRKNVQRGDHDDENCKFKLKPTKEQELVTIFVVANKRWETFVLVRT